MLRELDQKKRLPDMGGRFVLDIEYVRAQDNQRTGIARRRSFRYKLSMPSLSLFRSTVNSDPLATVRSRYSELLEMARRA